MQSSRPNMLTWWLLRMRQFLRLRHQKRLWQHLAHSEVTDGKYVLLALPSQPEGATLPAALHRHDLELLIRQLIPTLPTDVQLVLKVHPVQFMRSNIYTTLVDYWDSGFFRRLSQLDRAKIRLAPLEVSSQRLLDDALGLIVVNGSMGFEALSRGKRVIHTAPFWYEEAAGASLCRNSEDFRRALEEMLDSPVLNGLNTTKMHFAEIATLVTASSIGELGVFDMPILAEKFVASYQRFGELSALKWDV